MESKPRSKFLFCRAIYPKSGVHFIGLRSKYLYNRFAPITDISQVNMRVHIDRLYYRKSSYLLAGNIHP